MTEAVRRAATDAGEPKLLAAIDRVVYTQGSWRLTDPGRTVARRIGAGGARTVLAEVGVSQQEVINDALAAVAAAECNAVVVVGAEARAWERRGGVEADGEAAPPDDVLKRPPEFIAPIEIAAGLAWPVIQEYALIENALAAAENLSSEAQREEIAGLWSRFNEVATRNPDAAFGAPRSAQEIAEPGPGNRPLAYPYNLRHSTQWTVDQSSALLICSAELATQMGVPRSGWLFPHVALHCSEAVTLTARKRLHAWPAMGVLGQGGRVPSRAWRCVTCSWSRSTPASPPPSACNSASWGSISSGTPTLTGGMAFSGGPFNHYVVQSLVTLGRRLRDEPEQLGLVTTVSGMLSKPGLAVWSASPPRQAALLADLAVEVRRSHGGLAGRRRTAGTRDDGDGGQLHRHVRRRRRPRTGAHGDRRRPARWGPHGSHLRRCRDRPPRHCGGPRGKDGHGEGHDISTLNATPPRPGPPRLVDPALAARVPGLRRVAGVALLLAALGAAADRRPGGGVGPRRRPFAAPPCAPRARSPAPSSSSGSRLWPVGSCMRPATSPPWAPPTASSAGCDATSLRHTLDLGPAWLAGERTGELSLAATRGMRSLHAYYFRYLPQAAAAAVIPFLLVGLGRHPRLAVPRCSHRARARGAD